MNYTATILTDNFTEPSRSYPIPAFYNSPRTSIILTTNFVEPKRQYPIPAFYNTPKVATMLGASNIPSNNKQANIIFRHRIPGKVSTK